LIIFNTLLLSKLNKWLVKHPLFQQPFVLCIRESKLINVDDNSIKAIWGDAPYGYSYQSSAGASSGLITVNIFSWMYV